ncbi:hypothetical protein B296_00031774 [Ensete ventricosum]|uniref:Uncharacterized protein n=1 Tax=Ensete ventricosum TaxID=4639 RepID=A0A426Y4I7_ENSVE|nr:hypothetical protein B296_00031774 [Ensete ventricosum]
MDDGWVPIWSNMESFHAPTITDPSRTVPISYYGFVNTELDLNYQYTTTRNPRNLLGVIRSGSVKHHPLLSFTESPTSLDPLKEKDANVPRTLYAHIERNAVR